MAFKTMKLDGVTKGLSIHGKDLEAGKNESEENEWKRPVIKKIKLIVLAAKGRKCFQKKSGTCIKYCWYMQ